MGVLVTLIPSSCWAVSCSACRARKALMHCKNQLSKSQLSPKPDARGTARCTAGWWNRATSLSQPAITPAFEAVLGFLKFVSALQFLKKKLAQKEATQATLILQVTCSLLAFKEFM